MAEQNCPEKKVLLEFAAGRGDTSLRSAIQAHLDQCPGCRQTVATAAESTTEHRPRASTVADPLAVSGSYLGCDIVDVDSSEQYTRPNSSEEELHSRFDCGLLEPPREAGALGQLGKYVVLEVLGYGGMGVVFRAKDEQLLRTVAIKVMSRELASSATARRRFIREARAAAAINHPNVVTIHAVEEHQGTPFLVMELIQGESLRDRLRHRPKLEIGDVVSIAFQVASGLAAAHAHGVVHRDIKPGNVMLEDKLARVKITDFGLARVAVDNVDLTSNHIGIGTPAYMSPEQVKGEEIDPRTDLFALGCVMYAMLRGHSPFHGRTALEVARNVADREPSPQLADSGIPLFLSEIIDRLLQKSPDKRYQSAGEVAELLRRDLEEINRTPTDKLGQLLRHHAPAPARSKRPWLALSAAGVIGLGALTGLAGWQLGFHGSRPSAQPAGTPGDLPPTIAPVDPDGVEKPAVAPEVQSLVTVAQGGDADCTSISEALRRVAPGGEITILDAAEYVEAIRLVDAQRYAGVRLFAPQGATVRSNDQTALTIRGIPNLRVEGLTIVAPQAQFGIVVNGACPGLHLENIKIERIDNGSNAALVLRNGAEGSMEQPIIVRRLSLHSTNVGVVVGNRDTKDAPPRHIIIEESLIHGLSRENSTLLVLLRHSEDVVIRRNIFARGLQGLSILTEEQALPQRCQIEQNTWHNVERWIAWQGPVVEPLSIRIRHNLIVDAHGLTPVARQLASAASEAPVFANNLVVNLHESAADRFAPLAIEMPDFPILSLDPNHADYLMPDFVRLKTISSVPSPIPGRYSEPAAR
jgi:eukaryotic-like serine/threonine-protein kinase